MSAIDDLSPEQIEQIEQNAQKGGFSVSGFLNSGERLKNIIERDDQTLKRLGITHAQIADRLESIIGKAKRLEQLGLAPVVEDSFVVLETGFFGIQDCPFINPNGEPCQNYTSYDYSIENVNNGISITFSGLIMHLVRDHHFFEGSVSYRLDPEQVIKALDIQPGQDYSPKYVTEKIWRLEQGTTQNFDELERGEIPRLSVTHFSVHELFQSQNKVQPEQSEALSYLTTVTSAVTSADEVIKLSDDTYIYFWNGICVTVSDTDYLLHKKLIVGEGLWVDKTINKGVWVYKPEKNTYVEINDVLATDNKSSFEAFKPLVQKEEQTALNVLASSKNICPKCGYQNPSYRAKCKNCDERLLNAVP